MDNKLTSEIFLSEELKQEYIDHIKAFKIRVGVTIFILFATYSICSLMAY